MFNAPAMLLLFVLCFCGYHWTKYLLSLSNSALCRSGDIEPIEPAILRRGITTRKPSLIMDLSHQPAASTQLPHHLPSYSGFGSLTRSIEYSGSSSL
jgi:hypothetical protein